VAESGKEASFLAGGEFPVPVAQGSGANLAISVQYKEFGVRLNFTPVIHADRVHLKVRPEVSTLDFANGVLLNGFRIPALSTRRTETEVDLVNGQTFAIAGLINNTMSSTLQKIPGIGDIPILGLLFKSKQANKDQTELVVMITPEILQRTSSGVTNALPRTPEPFLAPLPDKKTVEPLSPAFTPARSSAAPARSNDDGSAAGAAAIVRGLNPPGPHVTVQPQGPAPSASPTTAAPAASAMAQAASPTPASGEKAKHEKVDRKTEKAEQEQKAKQAKLDRDQAKRDAESAKVADEEAKRQAKKDAEEAKRQAKKDAEAAKITAEQAKRQAEIERSHQKALDEAAAKVKTAEAAYQAQLGKKQ
jgi:hypothetical protein